MEQVKKEGVIKYIYAKKNIKHEKLKIRVISDCMMPLIDVDDIVEVADFQKYRRGDIVAIYFNNQIYIHPNILHCDKRLTLNFLLYSYQVPYANTYKSFLLLIYQYVSHK